MDGHEEFLAGPGSAGVSFPRNWHGPKRGLPIGLRRSLQRRAAKTVDGLVNGFLVARDGVGRNNDGIAGFNVETGG